MGQSDDSRVGSSKRPAEGREGGVGGRQMVVRRGLRDPLWRGEGVAEAGGRQTVVQKQGS